MKTRLPWSGVPKAGDSSRVKATNRAAGGDKSRRRRRRFQCHAPGGFEEYGNTAGIVIGAGTAGNRVVVRAKDDIWFRGRAVRRARDHVRHSQAMVIVRLDRDGESGLLEGVLDVGLGASQLVCARRRPFTDVDAQGSDVIVQGDFERVGFGQSPQALTSWFCAPRPSTPRRTMSPGFMNVGGFMPAPTPGGVPVVMISPGNSVKKRLA